MDVPHPSPVPNTADLPGASADPQSPNGPPSSGPVPPAHWTAWLRQLPASLLIGLVRVYQFTLSPLIGRSCRFEPTCSHYFIACVQQDGACRGAWRGLKRIARCHPFQPGGYDPP
jgi:putative membrane protein insertion efficiency factor